MKKKTCCTQTYNKIKITGEVCYLKFVSPRPVLFIVGEKAESAYFSKGAYDKALQPKGYIVIPGASHIDIYYKPKYIAQSVAKLTEFYSKNLKGT